jgi:hypothetical protein
VAYWTTKTLRSPHTIIEGLKTKPVRTERRCHAGRCHQQGNDDGAAIVCLSMKDWTEFSPCRPNGFEATITPPARKTMLANTPLSAPTRLGEACSRLRIQLHAGDLGARKIRRSLLCMCVASLLRLHPLEE